MTPGRFGTMTAKVTIYFSMLAFALLSSPWIVGMSGLSRPYARAFQLILILAYLASLIVFYFRVRYRLTLALTIVVLAFGSSALIMIECVRHAHVAAQATAELIAREVVEFNRSTGTYPQVLADLEPNATARIQAKLDASKSRVLESRRKWDAGGEFSSTFGPFHVSYYYFPPDRRLPKLTMSSRGGRVAYDWEHQVWMVEPET